MAEHCFSLRLRRGGAIQTVIDVPQEYKAKTTPVVMLGHGAGADMRSEFMEWFAAALSERGLGVVRWNFPYMERSIGGGRRPPDPMDLLVDCYHEVVAASSQRTGSPPGPLFVGGKSMGGRVASMLVAAGRVQPSGLVFLGYPLHPAGKQDKLRVDHLKSIHAPMLFVQGDRDALCNLDILRRKRKSLQLPGALHVVTGGDHSFKQLAARRAHIEPEMKRAADVVKAFVDKVLSR